MHLVVQKQRRSRFEPLSIFGESNIETFAIGGGLFMGKWKSTKRS